MTNILEISDGNTTINLLSATYGFCLNSWNPQIAQPKSGGVFQSSSLSQGRKLVDRKFENIQDTFNFDIKGNDQPETILYITKLISLLEQATEYWTGTGDKVWLKAKADCEDQPRYALISNYSWPELKFPYGESFFSIASTISSMLNVNMGIEHGLWSSSEPETSLPVLMSALETYDGRTLGNVDSSEVREPTSDNDVFFGNKRATANISDVYHFDTSGAAWSTNLMDAALPFDLYPDPMAAGDILYIGIDTTLTDSGPFSSVVFDLLNVATGPQNSVYEYYNGGWVTLTVLDGPSDFQSTGVNVITWRQPSDWTAVNLFTLFGGTAPNITGLWIRARITSVAAGTPVPSQQNRDIYSIVWPYVEIQSTEINGDITALANLLIQNRSANNSEGGNPELGVQNLVIGLRSVSRGEDFTAYINLADEQNPSGIDCTGLPALGAIGVFENDMTAPSGRRLAYNPAGVEAITAIAKVTIDETISPDFYGDYHFYLRARQSGGAVGDITLKIEANTLDDSLGSSTSPFFSTNTLTFENTDADQFFDLGRIVLPGVPLSSGQISEIVFVISAGSTSATPSLHLYDFILIPVDEWGGQFIDLNNVISTMMTPGGTVDKKKLNVDSITNSKLGILSTLQSISLTSGNPIITGVYESISVGEVIYQANARQRLWFFASRYEPLGGTDFISTQETNCSIQGFKNERYLTFSEGSQ